MTVPPPKTTKTPQRTAGFAIFLATGLIWLVIGGFAGRYLYPETVEKEVIRMVEKVVTQRVEVPIDRVVYRDVIKEVEKIVEVPVEKVVIRRSPCPSR